MEKFTDILQWAEVPIVSLSLCQNIYSEIDKATQICAGYGEVSEVLNMFIIF